MKSLNEVPIGSLVTETIEKYEATVVAVQIHANGCNRLILQENRFKDGKRVERNSTDIQNVKIKHASRGLRIDPGAASDVIGLKALDKTSGEKGIICVVEFGPTGQRDFYIQPSTREEGGNRREAFWIHEFFAELLEPRRPLENKTTGSGAFDCSINWH